MADKIDVAADDLEAVSDVLGGLTKVLPLPAGVTAGMVTAAALVKGAALLMRNHRLTVEQVLAKLEAAVPAQRPWEADPMVDTQPGTPSAKAAAKEPAK